MKRLILLVLTVVSLAVVLCAQPAEESYSRPTMQEVSATIQAELESHGDRVVGPETYRWSTRLQSLSDCRTEISIQITDHLGVATVHTDSVRFSMGALEPFSIDRQKNWLRLACAGREKCFFSTSVCSRKSKDGIVTDCGTASQKSDDSLLLNFDGDPGAALRLERAFHQAVDLCRQPKSVVF